MPGNPSLKGANRKRVWERGLHTGMPGSDTLGELSSLHSHQQHILLQKPKWGRFLCLTLQALIGVACFPRSLPLLHCKSSQNGPLHTVESGWRRLIFNSFLCKRTWVGVCLEGFIWFGFFPPSTFFSKTVFPVGWVFLFFKLLTEFFSPALLGLQFHATNLVGITVLGIPFWVPLPCNVWSPLCTAAVVHDISLAGEPIHCNKEHTGHTKAGFFFLFCSWINSLRCFIVLPYKTTWAQRQGWLLQAGNAPDCDSSEFCRWKQCLPWLAHASLHTSASELECSIYRSAILSKNKTQPFWWI